MRRRTKVAAAAAGVAFIAAGAWIAPRWSHPDPPAAAEFLRPAPGTPRGLSVRFFGTTTLAFGDGANAIMIDGYLSRPGLWRVLTGKLASDRDRIGEALGRAGIARLDELLVTHAHIDHALDAAAVAKSTGAVLVGSPSVRQIGLGGGLADDRIRVVKPGDAWRIGAFSVRAFRSLHSPDDRVPGEIVAPLRQPAAAAEYKQGGTWAFLIEHMGTRMLVHASANAVPGMYRGVRADVVFLATGGPGAQSDAMVARYWREVVEATGAKLVVPIHWDDFLRPLSEPMVPMRRFMDDRNRAMARLAPLARRGGVAIRYMPVIDPVTFPIAVAPAV